MKNKKKITTFTHKLFLNLFSCGYLFLFGFLLIFLSDAKAQILKMQYIQDHHYITEYENGFVNWTSGYIYAIGKASPLKPKKNKQNKTHLKSVPTKAKENAINNIIDVFKQIKINTSLTVGKHAAKKAVIMAGLIKNANDAQVVTQYYTSLLDVQIVIRMSMYGGFLQLVLPEEIIQISKIQLEENLQKTKQGQYTSLIINAKGIGLEPVLYPVIINEEGKDIYSSVFISREFVVQNGVCKYFNNIEKALQDKKAGEKPLVVKAIRKENSAIVLSTPDYNTIEKTTERHAFLKQGKVLIVLDEQNHDNQF